MGAPAVSGDVVIADAALRARYKEALDALQAQFDSDADAAQAYKTWRARRMPLADQVLQSREIRVLPLGRQPAIAVAADAGAQGAGAFDTTQARVTEGSVVAPPSDPTAALMRGWLNARLGIDPILTATEEFPRMRQVQLRCANGDELTLTCKAPPAPPETP